MSNAYDIERSKASAAAVLRICGRRGRVLVLMQNNPDPDAIGSAAALRDLVQARLRKRVTIGYGGSCGRAENRAMLKELRIDAHRVTPEDLDNYRILCLVDTQPRSGNNALYTARPANVVVDHHLPPKRRVWEAEFSDVRPEYGATSTILYEYVLALGHKMSDNLATALYYGIQSDTHYLGREAEAADNAAYLALFPAVDRKKLARIRRAPVPRDYFVMLHESLTHCIIAGRTVISRLGARDTPDMIPEVADMMLRLDGVRASVCYGLCGKTIHISVRTVDARSNAFRGLRRIVSRLGVGGGHRTMAGGQIPLEGDPEKRLALVQARILKTFAPNTAPQPLFDPRAQKEGQGAPSETP